jgi:hypothetical protein
MAKADSRRFPAIYIMSWSAVFLVAAAYLAALAARPDTLASFLPPRQLTAAAATPDPVQAAEIEALRRQIAALETDRSSLRRELARRTDHETNLTQRLAALQQQAASSDAQNLRLITTTQPEDSAMPVPVRPATREARRTARPATQAAAAVPAPPARTAAKTAAKAPARPTKTAAAAPAGRTLSDVERLAEQSQAALRTRGTTAIETGSVNPKPTVIFGNPSVSRPAAAGGVGVRLGTGPSVDALRMTWGLVNERGKAALDNLEPRYMTSPGTTAGATAYDLVAGPLPSAAEAQRICDKLRAQKLSCNVASYGGNAL